LTLLTGTSEITSAISNPTFNGGTGTINETVTITNTGSSTINGPFQVVLDSLEQGFTLKNATGNLGGWAYITVPEAGSLEPGQSASVD
jgi:hypothetical protein